MLETNINRLECTLAEEKGVLTKLRQHNPQPSYSPFLVKTWVVLRKVVLGTQVSSVLKAKF